MLNNDEQVPAMSASATQLVKMAVIPRRYRFHNQIDDGGTDRLRDDSDDVRLTELIKVAVISC